MLSSWLVFISIIKVILIFSFEWYSLELFIDPIENISIFKIISSINIFFEVM